MSLYVRLFTNFWTHRKTARLKILIGNDAYWILPRLWSYAAENQPDGDFSNYGAEEIAALIGYEGDALRMLEALQKSGFMDEMKIHDWNQHNEYHHVFNDRAKKAAEARWKGNDKKGKERIGKERSKHDSSIAQASPKHASSISEPKNGHIKKEELMEIVEKWNETTLPKCLQVTDKRIVSLKARLGDFYFKENWKTSLDKLKASPFCNGKNNTGWRADIDWFLRPDTITKIMEGRYDDRNGVKTVDQIASAQIIQKDFDPDNQ